MAGKAARGKQHMCFGPLWTSVAFSPLHPQQATSMGMSILCNPASYLGQGDPPPPPHTHALCTPVGCQRHFGARYSDLRLNPPPPYLRYPPHTLKAHPPEKPGKSST